MTPIQQSDKSYNRLNLHKVSNTIIYLEHIDKYNQAKEKPFLYKYYFGAGKKTQEVEIEIKYWFDSCLGAYNNINAT